jgi:hypothetical protein
MANTIYNYQWCYIPSDDCMKQIITQDNNTQYTPVKFVGLFVGKIS